VKSCLACRLTLAVCTAVLVVTLVGCTVGAGLFLSAGCDQVEAKLDARLDRAQREAAALREELAKIRRITEAIVPWGGGNNDK
jgi:hypothetical protein